MIAIQMLDRQPDNHVNLTVWETGDRPRFLRLAADGQGEYNQFMATRFKELEKQARALSAREKAALARVLIEDLDPSLIQTPKSTGLMKPNAAMTHSPLASLRRCPARKSYAGRVSA